SERTDTTFSGGWYTVGSRPVAVSATTWKRCRGRPLIIWSHQTETPPRTWGYVPSATSRISMVPGPPWTTAVLGAAERAECRVLGGGHVTAPPSTPRACVQCLRAVCGARCVTAGRSSRAAAG